ncbi:MAG TPA: hypothetical protein PLM01_04625 [Bacteroidales bacterium]|jgi:hypothetical protein|nr:hypothetical protein [Bacteroidales bacterium]HQJ81775.1 hypothetical protein [Bacteroidales bacterium]
MKALFLIGFISMSINLFGQNDSYYWYKGEKVPLKQAGHKKFILFEKENEDQVISDFTINSWEIIKSSEVSVFSTLIPYNAYRESRTKKWAFVINEAGKISDSLALQFSSKVLYASPFFMTKQGEEVGLFSRSMESKKYWKRI